MVVSRSIVKEPRTVILPGSLPTGSLPRVPGAPRVRAGPSHRHARRAAGDRGPWVSLPLRATSPEGNTVGQHADVDVGPSHRAPGLRAPGLIRARAGAEGAGTSTHRRRGDVGNVDVGPSHR